ncbi:MAG TPA: glycosyltransferase [Gemmatimonadaceae bacterium]|jgi:glycosyltransferase involved in cell wall biosynthesis
MNSSQSALSRTRVLHIIQNLNYGGMERLLADIVRGLDRARFDAHVLALQYLGRFADGLREVAQLHLAKPMSRWSMIRPSSLARQIASIEPDVVHTHSGVWFKASLAARMAGVRRIIHTEHGRAQPDPLMDRAIDALAARRTDVIVAVSERLAQQIVATHIAPATRVRVIPNGVETSVLRPRMDDGALRRELGISSHVAVLGSIGRLEPIKGYDIMVDAFATLVAEWHADEPPVLVVAGDGSEREALEHAIEDRGLRGRVYFLGWRNDIQSLLSTFTLFTMSSRSEGTSISLLEAMSSGLCPVVTDVGGNRAVLGDQLTHRLVPAGDARVLSTAWREALCDPVRRRDDAVLARMRVETAFDLRATIGEYEQLYEMR